ncbi:MAG: SDR family oxidoreductase [Gammaproteobacteria bacterium]|nr:SDR family oxidoreductase [Gammaproteobacteria bacterium]NNJ91059.1 SDR family oxidoreductase [Gammaproteobacteria bacterium]
MTKKQSILITGCSSGIGLHVARQLHADGYQVIASARKPEDVERLQQQGLIAIQLDVDDSDSIRKAVDNTLSITNGELYALFNNGAYGQPGAVEDLSRDVLRAQLETNLLGWHELTNLVIPVMRKQGYGRIIYNSSVLGFVAMAYRGAYNCSKFALEGLVDTLRQELHGTGIYLSLIEPGPIESNFRKNATLKFHENIDPQNSFHRLQYEAMQKRLEKEGPAAPFTLPPDAVYKRVIHALQSKRPKIRYAVTVPTYLFAFLKRVFTDRFLDRLLLRSSGGGKR